MSYNQLLIDGAKMVGKEVFEHAKANSGDGVNYFKALRANEANSVTAGDSLYLNNSSREAAPPAKSIWVKLKNIWQAIKEFFGFGGNKASQLEHQHTSDAASQHADEAAQAAEKKVASETSETVGKNAASDVDEHVAKINQLRESVINLRKQSVDELADYLHKFSKGMTREEAETYSRKLLGSRDLLISKPNQETQAYKNLIEMIKADHFDKTRTSMFSSEDDYARKIRQKVDELLKDERTTRKEELLKGGVNLATAEAQQHVARSLAPLSNGAISENDILEYFRKAAEIKKGEISPSLDRKYKKENAEFLDNLKKYLGKDKDKLEAAVESKRKALKAGAKEMDSDLKSNAIDWAVAEEFHGMRIKQIQANANAPEGKIVDNRDLARISGDFKSILEKQQEIKEGKRTLTKESETTDFNRDKDLLAAEMRISRTELDAKIIEYIEKKIPEKHKKLLKEYEEIGGVSELDKMIREAVAQDIADGLFIAERAPGGNIRLHPHEISVDNIKDFLEFHGRDGNLSEDETEAFVNLKDKIKANFSIENMTDKDLFNHIAAVAKGRIEKLKSKTGYH